MIIYLPLCLSHITDLSKAVDVYFDWIDHIAEENAAVEASENAGAVESDARAIDDEA